MLAGGVRPFDEAAIQELVRRDVEHAYNIAAGSQRIRGATSLRRRAADASPGTHAIPGTKDASRDVARVVSDVSVLCPSLPRHQLAERRQQDTIGRPQTRPPNLAPQYLQLMPQHQDLKLLLPLRTTKQNQQLEQTANDPVSERQALKQQTSGTHLPTLPARRTPSYSSPSVRAREKRRASFWDPQPSPVWLEPAWRAGIARYRAPSTATVMNKSASRRTWPQSDRLRSAASGVSSSSAW
jgi:hypothetical protein